MNGTRGAQVVDKALGARCRCGDDGCGMLQSCQPLDWRVMTAICVRRQIIGKDINHGVCRKQRKRLWRHKRYNDHRKPRILQCVCMLAKFIWIRCTEDGSQPGEEGQQGMLPACVFCVKVLNSAFRRCTPCSRIRQNHHPARTVCTPDGVPSNSTSAGLFANSPTVTTPVMSLIVHSSPVGSVMRRPCTSSITLPLSVTTPWR